MPSCGWYEREAPGVEGLPGAGGRGVPRCDATAYRARHRGGIAAFVGPRRRLYRLRDALGRAGRRSHRAAYDRRLGGPGDLRGARAVGDRARGCPGVRSPGGASRRRLGFAGISAAGRAIDVRPHRLRWYWRGRSGDRRSPSRVSSAFSGSRSSPGPCCWGGASLCFTGATEFPWIRRSGRGAPARSAPSPSQRSR